MGCMHTGVTSFCLEKFLEASSVVSGREAGPPRLCVGRKKKLQLFVRKDLDYVADEEFKLEGAGLGSSVTPLKMLWRSGHVFVSTASCYLVVKIQTKYEFSIYTKMLIQHFMLSKSKSDFP